MPHNDKRPAQVAGRSVVDCFAGNDKSSAIAPLNQVRWAAARTAERQSIAYARQGLTQRGADRFLTLALASTYALAARDAALTGAVQ